MTDDQTRPTSDPLAITFNVIGVLAIVGALVVVTAEFMAGGGGQFGETPNYLPAGALFVGGLLAFVVARFVRSLKS